MLFGLEQPEFVRLWGKRDGELAVEMSGYFVDNHWVAGLGGKKMPKVLLVYLSDKLKFILKPFKE